MGRRGLAALAVLLVGSSPARRRHLGTGRSATPGTRRQRPVRRGQALSRRLPGPDRVARRTAVLRGVDHRGGAGPAGHHLDRPAHLDRCTRRATPRTRRRTTPCPRRRAGRRSTRPDPAAPGLRPGRPRSRRSRSGDRGPPSGRRRTPCLAPTASAASRSPAAARRWGRTSTRARRRITCGSYGAIDPQIFVDRTGLWLLLKVEGYPDRIWVRRLNGSASGFAAGQRLPPAARAEAGVGGRRRGEPGDDPVPPQALPVLLRQRVRLDALRDRLRHLPQGDRAVQADGPAARRAGPTSPARAGRWRSSTPSATCGWPTTRGGPGNVGYPATDACLTSTAGCAQRRMYVATLMRKKKGRLAVYRYW